MSVKLIRRLLLAALCGVACGQVAAQPAPYVAAAIHWPNGKAQFFLNDGNYLRFDIPSNRVDAGYPKPINDKTWPGLQPYAAHLAGMVNWENNKAYIFLDDNRYLRYDIAADRVDDGYPKPVNDATWPGVSSSLGRRAMP